jgi:hypothetical protein
MKVQLETVEKGTFERGFTRMFRHGLCPSGSAFGGNADTRRSADENPRKSALDSRLSVLKKGFATLSTYQ